jgi:hypothetical protein
MSQLGQNRTKVVPFGRVRMTPVTGRPAGKSGAEAKATVPMIVAEPVAAPITAGGVGDPGGTARELSSP